MIVSVCEAKTQLSRLLDRVLDGEEIVIGRAGKPVARLVPAQRKQAPRVPGRLAGRIVIAEEFDAVGIIYHADPPEFLPEPYGTADGVLFLRFVAPLVVLGG